MTRHAEGPRGTVSRSARETANCLLLLLLLFLLPLTRPATAVTIGGRLGAELEGLGERFQTGGLFDERVLSDGTVEVTVADERVVSRDLATLGLLELRLEAGDADAAWFNILDTGRLGTTRGRNSLLVETGLRRPRTRLRFDGQWDLQAGEDDPAAGNQASINGTWDRDSLPLGVRSRLRLGADWSRSAKDSLALIFDYRVVRGAVELSRGLGPDLDLRAAAGFKHKDAFRARSGSYNARYGEIEADGSLWMDDHVEGSFRIEDRNYRADTLGIPSSVLVAAEARYDRRFGAGWRPFIENRLEKQDYSGSSGIFQDHLLWAGETGTDLYLSGLIHRRTRVEPGLGPDLRVRLGFQVERFRTRSADSDSLAFSTDYGAAGGLVGLALEGNDAVWADLTVEAGRRNYHGTGGPLSLSFEGLNLSLAASDFNYLHISAILQWTPVPWLRHELFAHWDQELHEHDSDDLRLWILNLSVTYPF